MAHSQLGRVSEIDRMIRDGEYPNADSLAMHWEVSRRVIFNDRRFLVEKLQAPLAFDRERGGWYYTEATWALPAVMVSQGELLAFFLSVEVARRNLGGALEAPLKQAVAKISRTLPTEIEVKLDDLRAHYSFRAPSSASADESTLLALHEAIQRQRETEIFYHAFSTGEFKRRVVQPYQLHNSRGDWYLVAFDHLRGDFRIFHIGRIARFKLLDKGFVRDADFDIGKYLRQAFVTELSEQTERIAIRFDEYQARYIRERRFHETQSLEELDDGGVILRFESGGLDEIKRWVMQYGAHAEVLAPPQLRQLIQRRSDGHENLVSLKSSNEIPKSRVFPQRRTKLCHNGGSLQPLTLS